jgi:hypothetical protein
MLNSVLGFIKDGKVEFAEQTPLAEGAKLLITFLPPENDHDFWLHASESSLKAIWDHPQDDDYAQLLQK